MPWASLVVLQRVVDLVGHPQQRQLAEGAEVADPEVVAERGVDLLGGVDVAVGHPPAQRLGRHVDQLDLVGGADDLVGDRLPLLDAGDALDDVVERLEVLDVDGGDDVDAGVEQLLDVLPALLVARAGDVGVGQLVDEDDLRAAGQDGVEVHLLEARCPGSSTVRRGTTSRSPSWAAVLRPAVGLDVADHDVGAALGPPPALVEHGEGLAHARRGAEVDPQRAPAPWSERTTAIRRARSRARLSSSTFTPGLAEEPERPAVGVVVDQVRARRSSVEAAGVGHPGGLEAGVGDRDVGVDARARGGDRVDGHAASAARPFSSR